MEPDSCLYENIEKPFSYSLVEPFPKTNIGLVQLSTDHTLERDWSSLKGSQAEVFSTRVHYSSHLNSQELESIASRLSEASKLIAVGMDMDVMAFGCTSASIVIGEERISKLLTSGRGNVPTTNPWSAALKAFRFLSAKRIGVFSPYPSEINRILYDQLLSHGFHVPIVVSLSVPRDTDITFVSKETMKKSLASMVLSHDLDLVFMSCTNLRVLNYIEEFEREFQIPIVSSNSAMFWDAMELSGKKARCPGYGHLLSSL